ncbi:hypothetical protein [Oceanicaulis alexandrii]|uniref:hypothetical protein n=1 Tax=Oceanicaulis alexandrii TaxID=153233 RepID=UPI0023539E59|nr:hypothetical protein [Oceanicaulis alexandrii]
MTQSPSQNSSKSDETQPASAKTEEAAGYLIEMLSALSHVAHRADLNNSSVMLATAAHVIEQECRHLTQNPPKATPGVDADTLFPYHPDGSPRD